MNLGEDVLVDVGPGDERPLSEVSDIVALLPRTFQDTCVRLRVFRDPDLPPAKVARLYGDVTEFLDEMVDRAP